MEVYLFLIQIHQIASLLLELFVVAKLTHESNDNQGFGLTMPAWPETEQLLLRQKYGKLICRTEGGKV